MGSLLSKRHGSLSFATATEAHRFACDLGFGIGFRMPDQGGRIETTDGVVFGEVWESLVGGQPVYGWGCKYGRLSSADWELKGSGGTIHEAMIGLTTSMFMMRAKRLQQRVVRANQDAKR